MLSGNENVQLFQAIMKAIDLLSRCGVGMNRWKYVAIVLIIVMLVGNAHAFTTLTALAQDETRTVTLEIERLKALDLSDDGVF